jgi:hypothetical protein
MVQHKGGVMETLEEFMENNGYDSFMEVLAQSTKYQTVDPLKKIYKSVLFNEGRITFKRGDKISFANTFAIKQVLVSGVLQDVRIKMKLTGDRNVDRKMALEKVINDFHLTDLDTTDYAWHHVDDLDLSTGEYTMELIKQSVHCVFGHYGAVWEFQQNAPGLIYDGSQEVIDWIYENWHYRIIN